MNEISELWTRIEDWLQLHGEPIADSYIAAALFAISAWFLRGLYVFNPIKAFYGEYTLFFWETDLSKKVSQAKVRVFRRLGWMRAKIVTANTSYTGKVRFTDRNIYFHLVERAKREYLQIVFIKPHYFERIKLWGIGSCVSEKKNPFAIRFLLTGDPITLTDAEAEFSSLKSVHDKHSIHTRAEFDSSGGAKTGSSTSSTV